MCTYKVEYNLHLLELKIDCAHSVFQVLNTSSSVTLTPEDLLNLGYKRTDDGELIKWADYWKLIVEVVDTSTQDYLIQVTLLYS